MTGNQQTSNIISADISVQAVQVMSPPPSPDEAISEESFTVNDENQSLTNDNEPAPSGLIRGLRGFLKPFLDLYVISTSYSRFSGHSDKDLADLVIDPESAIRDVERMCRWATEFIGLGTKVYCYNKGCDRATASTIWAVIEKRPRDVPVIIYFALHTEVNHEGQRAFLPADCPEDLSRFQSRRMIRYSKLSELLLARSNPAPIVLLTESCYSDNIMGLPFKYFVDRDLQMQEEETGCPEKDEWESKPLMIQFAAAMPDERAAWYPSIGAVYTQAFYNNSVRRNLGFEKMVIEMQESINRVFEQSKPQDGHCRPQTHVVYSSRKIQKDENIWSSLGLELK